MKNFFPKKETNFGEASYKIFGLLFVRVKNRSSSSSSKISAVKSLYLVGNVFSSNSSFSVGFFEKKEFT